MANEAQARVEFDAVVTGEPSEVMSKSNGGEYVLQNCKVTKGPLKGKIVAGTRTIKNKDGKAKSAVEVGTEIKLFLTRVQAREGNGMMNFFEISTGTTESQESLNSLLDSMFEGVAEEQTAQGTI